ncbi:threonine synthase [bacterium]|nr:threonine synthase [candidate division CSSED10-310 bacterium]
MFRYRELLPVINAESHVPLHIGWTPVYESEMAAKNLNLGRVFVKDDGLNPTASYKDRASAIAVARARELDFEAICTASTGNAAASLAACAASVHLPCIVIVPVATPQAKLMQMLAFGATVIPIDGSYDQAFNLTIEVCREFGWMNRSAGFNPYLVEGKKTGAIELAEQMGFDVPDVVFVSVGDGSIITGLCKGFKELRLLGFTDRCPKVIGVQAAGANVLVQAWNRYMETGEANFNPIPNPHTIADSICVGEPREGIRALKAVKSVGGYFMDVTDDEILNAMKRMPLETGVFGEPASATAYAGLIKASPSLGKDVSAAVLITGSGLKDLATAGSLWKTDDNPLEPSINSFDQILEKVRQNEER